MSAFGGTLALAGIVNQQRRDLGQSHVDLCEVCATASRGWFTIWLDGALKVQRTEIGVLMDEPTWNWLFLNPIINRWRELGEPK